MDNINYERIKFLINNRDMALVVGDTERYEKFKKELGEIVKHRKDEVKAFYNPKSKLLKEILDNLKPINKQGKTISDIHKLINNYEFMEDNGRKYLIQDIFPGQDVYYHKGHLYIKNIEMDYSLNLLDLYMLYNKELEYKEAILELMDILNLVLSKKEQKFLDKEKQKYANNIYMLREEMENYKYLYKLLGNYIDIIEEINYVNFLTATNSCKTQKKENLFYCPVRYLVKRMENGSITSVSKMGNLLALLRCTGLIIEIVPDNDNGKPIKDNILYYCKKFYIIKNYDEKLLNKANKISRKLLTNNITLSTISYKSLLNVDKELAENVYYNTKNTLNNKEFAYYKNNLDNFDIESIF